MPGSSKRADKEAAILDAGRQLFLRHGVRRTRVEEICRAAGVSKRTFYLRFRNREDLATRVLDLLVNESQRRIEAILAAEMPIEDKVRAIIAAKSHLAAESSEELYRELMTDRSALGELARQRQRDWDKRVRRFYREAQARGQIRQDIDVDLLMFMLVRAREIIDDPVLLEIEPDFSRRVESVMKLFFYGIVPRPAAPARGTRPRRARTP
jgi:AcrR family transcriptional regulator